MALVDPRLQKLVREALKLGIGCFGDGDRVPFIFLETQDKIELINLESADGTIDEALVAVGRSIIRQYAGSGQHYVLVWDGYLTSADKRQDAVFAEAGAAGVEPALLFAQRYKETKTGNLSKIGKPVVVAEMTNLWGGDGAGE